MANIGKAAEDAARAEKAVRMRAQGRQWAAIADECGYHDKSTAHRAVKTVLKNRLEDLALSVDELREVELEKLDRMEEAAWRVLMTKHVTVSHGRVITVTRTDPETDEAKDVELEDDGPVLQAIGTLLNVSKRRAALLGLDSATEINGATVVRYEVVGIDPAKLT